VADASLAYFLCVSRALSLATGWNYLLPCRPVPYPARWPIVASFSQESGYFYLHTLVLKPRRSVVEFIRKVSTKGLEHLSRMSHTARSSSLSTFCQPQSLVPLMKQPSATGTTPPRSRQANRGDRRNNQQYVTQFLRKSIGIRRRLALRWLES
jgi:hypothetical protein